MNKKIDAKMFRVVKLMLKDGETVTGTAKYFDLAESTVRRVKGAESYEEYTNIIAAIYAANKERAAKKAAKAASVTAVEVVPPATPEAPKTASCGPESTALSKYYSDNRVWDALKQQNELLTLISNKLTALLECWSN